MLNITLPDNSQRQYPGPVTVAEVAASIGTGLAKAALAGKIDGKVVDTSHLITTDSALSIITAKDADGLDVIRHSAAHLLAYAVMLQIERAPLKSDAAALIKACDKLANIRAVDSSPPTHWPVARQMAYLDWAEAVVLRLPAGADPVREAFAEALARSRRSVRLRGAV